MVSTNTPSDEARCCGIEGAGQIDRWTDGRMDGWMDGSAQREREREIVKSDRLDR